MKINVMQPIVLNGRWRLDESGNQLVDLQGSGTAVAMAPVAVRLLAILARSPNTVIGRRQLFDEGWRSYGFEVCQNSLNQVICALRIAFERLGSGAPSITTVPRIGYCLLATVTRHDVSEPMSEQVPAQATAPIHGRVVRPDDAHLVGPESFEIIAACEWRRAQRNGLPLSLLMMSPDTRTGMYGDAVAVAQAIEQAITSRIHRAGDLAAPYSSSEYAVLLPDTDRQGAVHVAREIQQLMHRGHGQGRAPHLALAVGQACTAQRRYATQGEWIEAARSALHAVLNGSLARATTLSCAS